jgi:hypothetical protein
MEWRSEVKRAMWRIRWSCRRMAQRMAKRPRMEGGTGVFPRMRTSRVPGKWVVLLLAFFLYCDCLKSNIEEMQTGE